MNNFLNDVKQFIGKVPFTKDAVAMYFCMLDSRTPIHVKATIAGALAYFLSPADAIPDVVAGLGFTDDAAVIVMTLRTMGSAITDEHRQKTEEFFEQ
jgi:uncharacterized membrane protein YkvA (DUF1232 family)